MHKIQLQMGYWGKIGGFCFLLKRKCTHDCLKQSLTFTLVTHSQLFILTTKFYLNKQLSITKHMQIRIKRWFVLTNNHTALIF